MSFFCCGNSDRVPGRINGNPYHNMCEKACIEVKKVFDACMSQQTLENVLITLTNFTPDNPTYPLTFTSAANSSPRAQITNLEINNTEKPNLSRVRGNVVIPLTVDYVDAQNVPGVAVSSLTTSFDVLLHVPGQSLMAYEIEALVGAVSNIGTTVANGVFSATFCITLIIKVVMEVDLLVPTYGYVQIPECQPYNQEVCSGFFETPIYPR